MERSDKYLLNLEFLGVSVNLLTQQKLLSLIHQSVRERRRVVIGNHNLHSLYLFHHDAKMREFYDCTDYVYIDGMPLVFAGKLFGLPITRAHRVTFLDVVHPFFQMAANEGWRVYFIGSKPGVAECAAGILREKIPHLNLATHHGYFDVASEGVENEQVLSGIREYAPDILMVGMGMPRQEHWVLDNLEQLGGYVVLANLGATMDYVAGAIPSPPRWMGRVGLEWLYRLGSEPGRLWRRYLVEPWFVVGMLCRSLMRRTA